MEKHLPPAEHIAEEDDEDTCMGEPFDMNLGQGLDRDVLGSIKIHGDWPEKKDEPHIGRVDGQQALLFGSPLTLTWDRKVSKLIIHYSDAHSKNSIVFTTNGRATNARTMQDGEWFHM